MRFTGIINNGDLLDNSATRENAAMRVSFHTPDGSTSEKVAMHSMTQEAGTVRIL